VDILNKLKQENLQGPTNFQQKKSTENIDPWRLISNEYQDLDSKDPRWFEFFMEYFIDAKNQVADDILFFVRQYVPSHKSSTGSINDLEPVLVKRRVAGQIPHLADVIDWKQSFFLNLISQLPCTLTVSICNKLIDNVDNNQSGAKKNGMMAKKRVTKKVFAAPYKSRMDVKDALMNECSYPLVYYTINDFQSESLHMSITHGEYLCAELSVTIPESGESIDYVSATDRVAEIPIETTSEPFPVPLGYSKIVLFQGAVSFAALSSVYQQKGIAAQSQMKNGWGKKSEINSFSRIEYVLMRGPHGKGQCQGIAIFNTVAIQEPSTTPITTSPSSMFGYLKEVVKQQLGNDSEKAIVPPDHLDCSMTYVNVPWQSIIYDLLEYNTEN
jgi:hypothetical protein